MLGNKRKFNAQPKTEREAENSFKYRIFFFFAEICKKAASEPEVKKVGDLPRSVHPENKFFVFIQTRPLHQFCHVGTLKFLQKQTQRRYLKRDPPPWQSLFPL